MSYQSPYTMITRKARIRPEISKKNITLPAPPALPDPPQASTLLAIFFSLTAITMIEFVFIRLNTGNANIYTIPLIAISGCMALSALVTLIGQSVRARRGAKQMLRRYQKQLQESEAQLKIYQWKERKTYMELNPPLAQYDFKSIFYQLLDIKPLLQYTFDEQNINLWARRPEDEDFLQIRIGIEQHPTAYHIQDKQSENENTAVTRLDTQDESKISGIWSKRNAQNARATSMEYARAIAAKYSQIYVPSLIYLSQQSPIGIVGPGSKLSTARGLMHAIISQVVYHHSPEDIRIIILAPRSQEAAWQWTHMLPHTIHYDPRQASGQMEEAQPAHACAIGTGAIMDLLPLISRELGRRKLLLDDTQQLQQKAPLLPHLLIVVDEFNAPGDLDQPIQALPTTSIQSLQPTLYRRPRLSISPLKRPEMALALSQGEQLGVSVLCTNASLTSLPATCQLLIDLSQEELPPKILQLEAEQLSSQNKRHQRNKPKTDEVAIQQPPQAIVRNLADNHREGTAVLQVDNASLDDLQSLALRIQSLRAATTSHLEMRTQVDLRTLFDPPINLANYDPLTLWGDSLFRTPQPLLRIPIGLKIGDEVQYLDLIKDGPHGLLVGQTGSGKSELLQTILLSLALAYRPTEINFLLLDCKAGLTLEPFSHLPHTIEFRAHLSSAAPIQRFMTMLQAEVSRRLILHKAGKLSPRLLIVIDNVTEMAQYAESIIDELFAITRVGPEMGIHLLFVSQQLDGLIGNKIRDYIHYRLCLRCASAAESREILRRSDAAELPVSIPGRAYLLHGDNQLDLFQAARVSIPIVQEQQMANAQSQLNALLLLPFRGK
jgi:DNA segregation ATPase FtsK/SpoIIIE-like protein